MGTFTVPDPPATTSDQQQSQITGGSAPVLVQTASSSTDKKTKSGKKSKSSSVPTQQQAYSAPITDSCGGSAGATGVSSVRGLPVALAMPSRASVVPGATAVLSAASTSQYSQPLLPMLDLDSETDSNHDTALTLACTGGR